jgi:ATP-dependent exoDNAse (exonuclease V) alpha subunit
LDELVGAANNAGAKVLLVGDPTQLSSVEAGGAFGLVAKDRGDLAPQLYEVRRFTHDWERHASLDLRRGRQEALDAYQGHGRLLGGARHQVLESLYLAWKAGTDAGRTSLMIAPDTATVTELNIRARAERVTTGAVNPEGVKIADGQTAGIGDAVITRQNDRRLSTGGRWVKNGDRWTITAIHDDGHITATRTDGNGDITLPAAYVTQHVQLAYATTAYQVQGRTVDTAHAFVSPTTTREVLYVSATRGRQDNRLYIDTHFDPDPPTGHSGTTRQQSTHEVLAAVLSNEGAETSAHEILRRIRNDAHTSRAAAYSARVDNTPSWTLNQETATAPGSPAAPDL